MSTPAPDAVKRLVDRFDLSRKVFLSGDYKEEQLRLEFLNPFFAALGWDVDIVENTVGKALKSGTPAHLTIRCVRIASSQ